VAVHAPLLLALLLLQTCAYTKAIAKTRSAASKTAIMILKQSGHATRTKHHKTL
jgi:hypothetical protein